MENIIKLTTGEYRVLDAGIFHVLDNKESFIEYGGLKMELVFKSDEGKAPTLEAIPGEGGALKLIFVNFNRGLDIGNTEPIQIAETETDYLFLVYRVRSLKSSSLKTFEFSLLAKKKNA